MANDLGAKRFIAVKLGSFQDHPQDSMLKVMRVYPCRNLGQIQASSSARTVQLTVGLKLYQALSIRDRNVKNPMRPELVLSSTKIYF